MYQNFSASYYVTLKEHFRMCVTSGLLCGPNGSTGNYDPLSTLSYMDHTLLAWPVHDIPCVKVNVLSEFLCGNNYCMALFTGKIYTIHS